jgi:hypothetical protein
VAGIDPAGMPACVEIRSPACQADRVGGVRFAVPAEIQAALEAAGLAAADWGPARWITAPCALSGQPRPSRPVPMPWLPWWCGKRARPFPPPSVKSARRWISVVTCQSAACR